MRSFTEVVAASKDDDDDEEEECLLPERKCFTRPDIVLEKRERSIYCKLLYADIKTVMLSWV